MDESSLIVNFNSGEAAGKSTPRGNNDLPTSWTNIISKNSGKCLSIGNSPKRHGLLQLVDQWTCVGGTNQEFMLTPVTGGYKITARNSNLKIGVQGGLSVLFNGARILQSYYNATADQIWIISLGRTDFIR